MLVETERLVITDLTKDMCNAFQKNSVDEDNRRFVPDEVFETLEDAHRTIEWLIKSYQYEKGPFLYPVLLKDKTNIGYVQACSIEEGWELGYHIAKEYTGHGYATEAVSTFLPVIMQQLKINIIYGIVLEENIASHKVLEKCNFKLDYIGIGKYQGVDKALRRYILNS
ncbi:GNAT family N-acetyltransferase [Clostridium oryzae]|uniref:N-acetyltransferase domain-containing protein n=1 Tax=Clostridium oryzae TaxID=1450648 RepID=A0A1V4IMS7_9CLOT|nr:GNAT family N-acetyltransferase [Clostridium oryzae]OPJ61159.1 hypothetical protein CLORY_23710 [Clostridium oryzae]